MTRLGITLALLVTLFLNPTVSSGQNNVQSVVAGDIINPNQIEAESVSPRTQNLMVLNRDIQSKIKDLFRTPGIKAGANTPIQFIAKIVADYLVYQEPSFALQFVSGVDSIIEAYMTDRALIDEGTAPRFAALLDGIIEIARMASKQQDIDLQLNAFPTARNGKVGKFVNSVIHPELWGANTFF